MGRVLSWGAGKGRAKIADGRLVCLCTLTSEGSNGASTLEGARVAKGQGNGKREKRRGKREKGKGKMGE